VNEQRLTMRTDMAAQDVLVIHVTGDFSGHDAASERRALVGVLTGTPRILILDVSGVARIDATGLDALHAVAESAAEHDIGFCLVARRTAQSGQLSISRGRRTLALTPVAYARAAVFQGAAGYACIRSIARFTPAVLARGCQAGKTVSEDSVGPPCLASQRLNRCEPVGRRARGRGHPAGEGDSPMGRPVQQCFELTT
jgi:anti-anti-sigma regulatory factor